MEHVMLRELTKQSIYGLFNNYVNTGDITASALIMPSYSLFSWYVCGKDSMRCQDIKYIISGPCHTDSVHYVV